MAPIGFQFKLWKILDVARSNSIIRWNPDGTAVIVNEANFDIEAVDCYPKLLRCPDALNLRRMFHWYFFNRIAPVGVDGNELINHVEYRHPLFIRGRSDLLQTIVSRYPAKRVLKNVDVEPAATARAVKPLPLINAPRRRSLESPPIVSSIMSLKNLTLFRLPKFLKLDEDVAEKGTPVQRRPLSVWPSSAPSKLEALNASREVIFERRVRPGGLVGSCDFDAIVGSLPPPAFVDHRLFTVKLRTRLQSEMAESGSEDEDYYTMKDFSTSDDSENCRPVGDVSTWVENATGADEFGDEHGTWFGLDNGHVIEAVAFEECEASAWTEGDVEAGEPKLYTELTVL